MGRKEENFKLCGSGAKRFADILREDGKDGNGCSEGSFKKVFEGGVSSKLVNPKKLPALPLSWRKGFPKACCIYFALSDQDEVLYIGRAFNLHTRWSGQTHQHFKKLALLQGVKVAWLEVSDRNLLPQIEYDLIEHFDPPLNVVNALRKAPFSTKLVRKNGLKVRVTKNEYELLKQESIRRNTSMSQAMREIIKENLPGIMD